MPKTRDGGRSPWQFSSFLARASGGLFETATTIAINFLVLRSGSRLLHPEVSIEICYVIAPDPVLLRAHGSFLTPRWREPDSNCWYYQRQPTATDAPPGILVFEDGRLPPEQQSEFALDSLLEGEGFELLVPRHGSPQFPKCPGTIAAPTV